MQTHATAQRHSIGILSRRTEGHDNTVKSKSNDILDSPFVVVVVVVVARVDAFTQFVVCMPKHLKSSMNYYAAFCRKNATWLTMRSSTTQTNHYSYCWCSNGRNVIDATSSTDKTHLMQSIWLFVGVYCIAKWIVSGARWKHRKKRLIAYSRHSQGERGEWEFGCIENWWIRWRIQSM